MSVIIFTGFDFDRNHIALGFNQKIQFTELFAVKIIERVSVSEQFLRSFGVRSIEDLPQMDSVQIEEFKVEAEQEVSVKLDI